MITCDICGAGMVPNPRKAQNPKAPDWLCSQQNGPCGTQNGKWFNETAKWDGPRRAPLARPASLPPRPAPIAHIPPTTVPAAKPTTPDWDKIAEGKVRHGVVIAMIGAGKEPDFIKEKAPELVKFIMGTAPAQPPAQPPAPAEAPTDIDINNIPF